VVDVRDYLMHVPDAGATRQGLLQVRGTPLDGHSRTSDQLFQVSKEALLKDIQFRGAISEFHRLKSVIQGTDLDPILLRLAPANAYADGSNFEVVCLYSAICTALQMPFKFHAAPHQQHASLIDRGLIRQIALEKGVAEAWLQDEALEQALPADDHKSQELPGEPSVVLRSQKQWQPRPWQSMVWPQWSHPEQRQHHLPIHGTRLHGFLPRRAVRRRWRA
jgi:hypothetical protein